MQQCALMTMCIAVLLFMSIISLMDMSHENISVSGDEAGRVR